MREGMSRNLWTGCNGLCEEGGGRGGGRRCQRVGRGGGNEFRSLLVLPRLGVTYHISLSIGAMVDQTDPKNSLALTLLGSVASHALVAGSGGMGGLYLARTLPGLLMATMLVTQAGVAQYFGRMSAINMSSQFTPQKDESKSSSQKIGVTDTDIIPSTTADLLPSSASALGRLFLQYRLGAAVGTTAGGYLIAPLGAHGVAAVAAAVSAAAAGLGWLGVERLEDIGGNEAGGRAEERLEDMIGGNEAGGRAEERLEDMIGGNEAGGRAEDFLHAVEKDARADEKSSQQETTTPRQSLCCNKVKPHPWSGSMIHGISLPPLSSTPPPSSPPRPLMIHGAAPWT